MSKSHPKLRHAPKCMICGSVLPHTWMRGYFFHGFHFHVCEACALNLERQGISPYYAALPHVKKILERKKREDQSRRQISMPVATPKKNERK